MKLTNNMKFQTLIVGTLVIFLSSCSGGSSDDNSASDEDTETENQSPSEIGSTVFENDFQGWADTVDGMISTIDFESVSASLPVEIVGDEFNSQPAGPVFSAEDGTAIFIGNPSSETNQELTPVSGLNMLFPTCDPSCEGVIRVDFENPVTAFGAFFIDVEDDFISTGFSLSSSDESDISFTSSLGQNIQGFLGFIATTAFNTVFIHFATGPNIDGVVLDDISYVPGS